MFGGFGLGEKMLIPLEVGVGVSGLKAKCVNNSRYMHPTQCGNKKSNSHPTQGANENAYSHTPYIEC